MQLARGACSARFGVATLAVSQAVRCSLHSDFVDSKLWSAPIFKTLNSLHA